MRLLKNVNPEAIKIPDLRVTARFDEESRRQFEESVKNAGVDEPVRCYDVDGQLWLSDGLHRVIAAIQNKQKINVYLLDGGPADVLIDNLKSGHLRGKHPVSEMVKVIEALWKEYQLDSEAIAKKTGMTRDYVENLMLISELTPMCREALDDGRIKVGHALALTRLKDPVKQETMLFQITTYNLTVKSLGEIITDALTIPTPAVTGQVTPIVAAPVKIKCAYCGGEYENANIANPNTCRECSGVLAQSITEARRQIELEQKADQVNVTP